MRMFAILKFRTPLATGLATTLVALILHFTPNVGNKAEAASPGLSQEDIQTILNQAEAGANVTNSGDGLRSNTVPARDGKLLKVLSMPDAWVGSIDIAIAKARTAAFFSSDENALTSRIIGV